LASGQRRRWGYMVMWEFVVKPGMEARFEQVYGASGEWARLFQQDKNNLGTELNRGQGVSPRYTTLDFWLSEEAYERFRTEHLVEYQEIDRRCEQLTESERKLATFVWAV
jgi:hypothetical protein